MLLSTWTGPTKRPPAPRKAGGGGGPQAEAEARAARREAAAADSLAGLAVGCLRELLGGAAALGGLRLVAWVLRGLPIHCQDTQVRVGWLLLGALRKQGLHTRRCACDVWRRLLVLSLCASSCVPKHYVCWFHGM